MNDPYQILGVSENASDEITTTTIRWRIWRRRR